MEKRHIVEAIESDALRANLLETAGKVVIDPELLILLEPVEKFKGLHSTLEKLLYEVCHPFRNWRIILPQLRSFVLKNIKHYLLHEKGAESLNLFSSLFFDAIKYSQKDSFLLSQAI